MAAGYRSVLVMVKASLMVTVLPMAKPMERRTVMLTAKESLMVTVMVSLMVTGRATMTVRPTAIPKRFQMDSATDFLMGSEMGFPMGSPTDSETDFQTVPAMEAVVSRWVAVVFPLAVEGRSSRDRLR